MPAPKGYRRRKIANWKRVCAPGSIRTVKSGKARVLVCCPKGKRKRNGRCKVGMSAVSLDVPRFGSLRSDTKKEHREHPWTTMAQARRIARDHAKGFGEHWLDDPRLPDRDLAMSRIHGDKRPSVSEPWRAPIVAEKVIPPRPGKQGIKIKVVRNRTGTRFWFTATYAPDYSFMADYATTTSKRIAQGWIDALSRK